MTQMDIVEFLQAEKGLKNLRELAAPLVAQLNGFCEEQGIMGMVEADLICIRCSQSDIYEARRKDMESKSEWMYQAIAGDRRTSFIKLKESIVTEMGAIEYLELCDQKPDNSQDDRISHITVVPVTSSYEEIINKLKEKGLDVVETVRPHYTSADVKLPSGFTMRIGKEFLVDKIKREEMI